MAITSKQILQELTANYNKLLKEENTQRAIEEVMINDLKKAEEEEHDNRSIS